MHLLPAWTGKSSSNAEERSLFALPIWLGGLGVINPVHIITLNSQAIVNQQR